MDSTAHALKFAEFQNRYFEDAFESDFEIEPRSDLKNLPKFICPSTLTHLPEPGIQLEPEEFQAFVQAAAQEIAGVLDLKPKD